jgi:hypothetical protein
VHSCPPEVWQAFTKFRLAGSMHTMKRALGQSVQDDLQYGKKFEMYGIHPFYYDNIGFKARANYVQSTAIYWADIPFKEVLNGGIYNASLVRKQPHSMLPTAKAYGAEDQDYVQLHTRSRAYIAMVLSELPGIPTVAELKTATPDYYDDIEIPRRLVYRDRRIDGIVELEVQLDADEQMRFDEASDATHSDMYSANFIKPDNVRWTDLNTTETCVELCKYNISVIGQSLREGALIPTDDEDLRALALEMGFCIDDEGKLRYLGTDELVTPIHAHTGALMMGDGSPSYSIQRLFDSHVIERDQLYNFIGPFHTYLEGWKSTGALFRDSHMHLFVYYWRPSEGQANWYLAPGDPRQCEHEAELWLLANFISAAWGCMAKTGRTDVSVADVEGYMLERAREQYSTFCYICASWRCS